MRIFMKNIPAKFHPGPFWNNGALGFFVKWHNTRHLESMTSCPKFDAYSVEEHCCHIYLIWNDGILGFLKRSPEQEEQQQEEQDE